MSAMKQLNILLLNPPGKKLYIRDYYCSKVSKASYLYEPVDLLILSGILSVRHAVHVIDAIAEKLSPQKCLERIVSLGPDVIISLTGAVSFPEDVSFWKKIKTSIKAIKVFSSGDILMDETESTLANIDCLDGIILDFTDSDILTLLEDMSKPLNTIIHKYEGRILKGTGEGKKGVFDIPMPRHELFPLKKYIYPFIKESLFATVLTDYGCPYRCSFCIMSTLPYKWRSVNNVMEELWYVKGLGVKDVYFDDQTFGVIRKRGNELCWRMIDEKLGLGWCCFSRVDMADEETLRFMKEAGCHTVMYGVESGSDEILKKYSKDTTRDQISRAFDLCKKVGLRTVATFVLGLPDDSKETVLETIRFSKEIDPDYASFNIYVPRMHTKLRGEVLEKGLLSPDVREMDQSGSYSVAGTNYLSSGEVLALKEKAVREFYLRPTYLLKRAKYIDSLFDIKREVLGGLAVVKDIVASRLRRR